VSAARRESTLGSRGWPASAGSATGGARDGWGRRRGGDRGVRQAARPGEASSASVDRSGWS